MPVLQPNEYDQSYFDGGQATYQHNAGYTRYTRWYRKDPGTYPEDTGEYFKDLASRCKGRYNLNNKKVLELGCAKGFVVQDLREIGVEAYGIDVSQYAYDEADPTVKPYITVADARNKLADYKRNEFDLIFSRWFIECIDDADLPDLIDQMNRIARNQVHVFMNKVNPDYYNEKTLEAWKDNYDWKVGTIFIKGDDWNNYLTKIN